VETRLNGAETEVPQSRNEAPQSVNWGGTERKLRRTQSGNREEDPEDTIWLFVTSKITKQVIVTQQVTTLLSNEELMVTQ